MLANAIIFFHCFDELTAFKSVVRARFFYVNIFSGLTAPDTDKRMPVIWSGDGDGVNFFIFEKLANVPISFWSGRAKFFDFGNAFSGNVFVDVTERGDFYAGNMLEAFDV